MKNELHFDDIDVHFIVGEPFMAPQGSAVVLGIDDVNSKIIVECHEGPFAGKIKEFPLPTFAYHVQNAKIRRRNKLGVKKLNLSIGSSESFSLGFLAANGKLTVRENVEGKEKFEQVYKELTGDIAPEPVKGSYYKVLDEGAESWPYYDIFFACPNDSIKLLMNFEGGSVHWNWEGGAKVIGKQYILNLLGIGFKLGTKHDIEEIRNHVSDKVAFEKGMAVMLTTER